VKLAVLVNRLKYLYLNTQTHTLLKITDQEFSIMKSSWSYTTDFISVHYH